jgi:hypothetical protein
MSTTYERLQAAIDEYLADDSISELIDDLHRIINEEEDYHLNKALVCTNLRNRLFKSFEGIK